jgi:hypothetical protein
MDESSVTDISELSAASISRVEVDTWMCNGLGTLHGDGILMCSVARKRAVFIK